jgi:phosphoribosyl 1,2-cyclic phosphodiesterase
MEPLEPDSPPNCLLLSEAKHIIAELKPEVAILTHLNMAMGQVKPWEVVQG